MGEPPAALSEPEQAFARAASEPDRRRLLAAYPDLRHPQTVAHLGREVGRNIWVDLGHAERLAAAAQWLAEELDDERSRAYAARAWGNVLHFQRKNPEALDRYREAIRRFEAVGEANEAAITRSSGLTTLIQLGDYTKVMAWSRTARKVFERTGDSLRLARLEHNLANLLTRRDRNLEAQKHYQSAYELFTRVGSPQDISTALRNMAVSLQTLNDFPASLAAYQKARDFCREHGFHKQAVEIDYNIAYLYYLQGEYNRALHLYERARKSCEELGDHYHTALCDLDLAEMYLELNLVQEAQRLAARGYDGFIQLGLEYEAAKTLTLSAIAAARSGRSRESLETLVEARGIFARQQNPVWAAVTDLCRATVYQAEGRGVEAQKLARRALDAFRAAQLPAKTALCELVLAELELQQGRPSAARDACGRALDQVRDLGISPLEYKANFVRGLAAEALGDTAAALEAFRTSHEHLERLRGHLRSDELRVTFLEDKLAVYEALVALSLEDDRLGPNPQEAFQWIEKAKSRGLADLISFGAHALPSTTGREDLVSRLRSLRDEVSGFYRQIYQEELSAGNNSVARVSQLRQAVATREDEILAVLRRLQADDAEFRSLQDSITVDLDTVRSSLGPGTLLVEYFIARGTVYLCLIDQQRLQVLPVATEARVRELQHQLRLQLSKFQLGDEYLREFQEILRRSTASCLTRLYDELLRPAEPYLDGRHLAIVGHGPLHYIPFQALYDGERYLIDRFSISYAPSATVLHLCCARGPAPGKDALVLGVPDERAPQIRQEAEAVAAALDGSRLLLGEQATRQNLERFGGGCRYLHVATHGFYRRDNPMFSAVQLGDSRLSLLDLYSLRLQAELVVLSGCATGLGSVRGADELIGLSRGLLYAGARSVVVTLWDVNDESTARYMTLFYRHLTSGEPPAIALRRAVRELRRTHPHPYYWAPFVLIGQPGIGLPPVSGAGPISKPGHRPSMET